MDLSRRQDNNSDDDDNRRTSWVIRITSRRGDRAHEWGDPVLVRCVDVGASGEEHLDDLPRVQPSEPRRRRRRRRRRQQQQQEQQTHQRHLDASGVARGHQRRAPTARPPVHVGAAVEQRPATTTTRVTTTTVLPCARGPRALGSCPRRGALRPVPPTSSSTPSSAESSSFRGRRSLRQGGRSLLLL